MNIDFRNIDVAEELSLGETTEMLNPSQLVDRLAERRVAVDEGISLPWSKFDGLFKFREGELVLMGGFSGHMKTTVSTQMALWAMRQGKSVGIASLELPAPDIIEQMVEIGAGRSRPPLNYVDRFAKWADNFLHIYDKTDTIKPEDAMQMTIAFAKHKGCKLVILDALMMMGVTDELNTEAEFTRKLAAVAKKFKVCILLIHHVRKPMGETGEKRMPGKYDFIGSSHLVNIASSVLLVWHDKEKAYARNDGQTVDDTKPDLLIKVAKQRNHHYEGVTGLWQHDDSKAFCSTSQRNLPRVDAEWRS